MKYILAEATGQHGMERLVTNMANKNLLIDLQNSIDDIDYGYDSGDHDCTLSPDDGCRVCFARAIGSTPHLMIIGGMLITVDEEDVERVNQHNWYMDHGYLRAKIVGKNIYLHRFLLEAKEGEYVDHKNGNKLDNRRSNLRICTHRQNIANKGMSKNNKSGFKGVCWNKDVSKWMAYIKVDYKLKYLGVFTNKVEAAKVYDKAARKYFGEFARTNFQTS